jgi:hypothetical protein
LDKREDTGEHIEYEDSDHRYIEHPFAPEGVGSDQPQDQEGNRDLAGCEAKDAPRLRDPVVLDDQRLLFGLQIE